MTSVTMEWESRLGRRLRLRDLYILSIVVGSGGMAKAARQLAMSQPAVSEAISNLEHVLGIRLLNRSRRGIEPTAYADAILKRAETVFDELKQGIRDIEFLADPTRGEVRIGCSEIIAATILPPIIHSFSQAYPRVVIHLHDVTPLTTREKYRLREQKLDLLLGWLGAPIPRDQLTDDLNVEILFESPFIVAVGMHTRWARRRKIDLAELIREPWVLGPPNDANYLNIAQAFQIRNLPMPKTNLFTLSLPLRTYLLANGDYIAAMPKPSAIQYSLKILPIDLCLPPWPFALITLKNRMLSPIVELFIKYLSDSTKALSASQSTLQRATRSPKR